MMLEDAYGERRANQIIEDTWGHLHPEAGRHDGYLVAAFSAYGGERLLITAEFRDQPDSPWLYDAMYRLILDADMDEGAVYRFTGAVIADGKQLRFDGEWTQILIAAV
ncbi:hypothetical protein, partial [Streptomyces sp.]|uniref:hypothetical protein n=1 Tax=Streptomyces sp. TaxID=1931 RepID=UPI002F9586E2